MVFRNWEILRIEDLWFCKCEQIEVMNYMANFMLRKNNCHYNVHICMKAHFALKRRCCNMSLNFTTLFSPFDAYVKEVLLTTVVKL